MQAVIKSCNVFIRLFILSGTRCFTRWCICYPSARISRPQKCLSSNRPAGVPRTRFIDDYAHTQTYMSIVSRLDIRVSAYSSREIIALHRAVGRSIFVLRAGSLFVEPKRRALSIETESKVFENGERRKSAANLSGTIIDLPLAHLSPRAKTFR